jgi:HlyD family secretion protein
MKRRIETLKQGSKLITVVLLTTALAVGCTSEKKADPNNKTATQEQQMKSVKVAKITKQNIGDPLEQVGDVVSSIQLDVMVKGNGEVMEILKKRGETVAKGDVLFKLDPIDVQLQKEQSQLAIKSAEAQLTKAREDLVNGKTELQNSITKIQQAANELEKAYNNTHNEYDLGAATKQQLEQAETQLNNMKLDLESLRKKLKTLETTNSLAPVEVQLESAQLNNRSADRSLSNLEVKAPVGGVLTDLNVEVGMALAPGFKAGQVQQTDPVKIKSTLTEAAAALVRGKKELTFYISGSTDKRKATISFLSDIMDASTKSYSLELDVPNSDKKLKPGSKAQILLTDDAEQIVTAVPTLSIVREGSDSFVFILVGDTVQKRKVELGRLKDTNQEVLSGVKPDEALVISGQHQLKDQEKVQVAAN